MHYIVISYSDFNQSATCSCNDNLLFIPGTSIGGMILIEIYMRSPPNTDIFNGIEVYTASIDGPIESIVISIQITQPGAMNIATEINNYEINAYTNYLVTMYCQNPISQNANLNLLFSNDIMVENSIIIGLYGLVLLTNSEIIHNMIWINNSFTEYLIEKSTITLSIQNLENPSAVSSDSLTATIFTAEGGEICSGISYFSFTPYEINPVSIYPKSWTINDITIYTISMNSSFFTMLSEIIITFPKELSFVNPQCSLNSSCVFQYPKIILNKLIFANNIFTTQIQGIMNSNNTANTSNFFVQIFSNSSLKGLIAENNEIVLQFNPGVINATIIPTNTITGEIANYIIQLKVTNKIPWGGYLEIYFPEEIEITANTECKNLTGLASSSKCIIQSNIVTLSNAFSNEPQYLFDITLTNIINPTSTCKSSSFKIQSIYNENLIDITNTKLYITMTTSNQLNITIKSTSYTVGKISAYTFSIYSSNYIANILQISIPSDILIGNPVCSGITIDIIFIGCKVSSDMIIANISLSLETKFIEFIVSGFINSHSLQKPESFYIKSLEGICMVDEGNATITMLHPGALTVNFSSNDTLINHPASYTFIIGYSNSVPVGGILNITFSNNFLIPVAAYCSYSCEKLGNSIIVSAIASLTIYNLQNPISSTEEISIYLSTHTSDSDPSYLIDTFPGYSFQSGCSNQCISCVGQSSLCTSCSSSYILFNSTCIQKCPFGYGYISSTCLKCNNYCMSCSFTTDFCISCYSGYLLYNGTCITSCPEFYTVLVDEICENCSRNCLLCEGSIENCTSCNVGFNFYMNQCLEKCPVNYYAVNGVCSLCPCSNSIIGNGICDNECNIEACNYDNGDCQSSVSVKSLPSVTAGVGTVAVTSASKALGGGQMMGSTLAVWGLTQSCSWIAMAYSINSSRNLQRRLSDDNYKKNIIFDILITLLVLKLMINLFFTLIYFLKIARNDNLHYEWVRKHKFYTSIIGILSGIFSFQLIRLTYSGPKCSSCCKGLFFQISAIYTLIIAYSVTILVLIIVPVIGLLSYSLVIFYENDNNLYIQAIDCLSLTILIAITSIFDLVSMSISLGRESVSQRSNSIIPLTKDNCKIAEDTFETKFDEASASERKTKYDCGEDFAEPEIEESFIDHNQKILHIGDIIENLEEIDYENAVSDQYDPKLLITKHKGTGYYLLLKENRSNSDNKTNTTDRYKIIDIKHPKKGWTLGRKINECKIKLVSVAESGNSHVSAIHLATGYNIIIDQPFTGNFLNDLSTGTPLSKILSEEDSINVIPDKDNLYYGMVTIDNSDYRVRRRFNNSLVVDVILKDHQQFDVSFDGEFDIIEKSSKEESSEGIIHGKSEENKLSPEKLKELEINPFKINENSNEN